MKTKEEMSEQIISSLSYIPNEKLENLNLDEMVGLGVILGVIEEKIKKESFSETVNIHIDYHGGVMEYSKEFEINLSLIQTNTYNFENNKILKNMNNDWIPSLLDWVNKSFWFEFATTDPLQLMLSQMIPKNAIKYMLVWAEKEIGNQKFNTPLEKLELVFSDSGFIKYIMIPKGYSKQIYEDFSQGWIRDSNDLYSHSENVFKSFSQGWVKLIMDLEEKVSERIILS